MPEGPETKRMADKIKSALVGKKILKTTFLYPTISKLNNKNIIVKDVISNGKAILIRLNNNKTIISHNQLYGKWSSNYINTPISHNRSLRIEFITKKKAVRLWSATDINVLDSQNEHLHPYLKKIGPDVLSDNVTFKIIFERLISKKFRNRQLSSLLLDQHFIAGIGNYLRTEILFFSGLMYNNKPSLLSKSDQILISKNIKDISLRSYFQKGITISKIDELKYKRDRKYRKNRFMAFARAGRYCFICNNKISKKVVGSRRIYFCIQCQK